MPLNNDHRAASEDAAFFLLKNIAYPLDKVNVEVLKRAHRGNERVRLSCGVVFWKLSRGLSLL